MGEESGSGGGSIDTSKKRGSGVSSSTPMNKNLTSAKQEEFVNPGSRFTGTATPTPSSTRGMSPMDVQVISGGDLSEEQKANVAGTAGLNVDNWGNLQQRATTDAIQGPLAKASIVAPVLNAIGKKTATEIRNQIASGGTQVLDTSGKIVGVVSKNSLGLDVYTGGTSYDPLVTGKKPGTTGYVMSASDVRATESAMGGGEGGDAPATTTTTAATATDVTGSTVTLNQAARRRSVQALGGGGGAGNRRSFIA